MVVESRSVIRNAKNVRGQVVRALFSLCSFLYVPTILSESLAQATANWTEKELVVTANNVIDIT